MQESGESLEAFHAALTAQAARSELGTLENEIIRDLFISKMKNMTLQDTLTFEILDPEEVLKRAMKFEHSKLTTMAFQKTNAAATGGTSNNYTSGVRIKQEPVMAVRNLSGTTKNQNRRESNKKQKNNKNHNVKTKPRNRCGRAFDQGHLKNCSAMGKTCKNCVKPNQFAKMCRSQQISEVAEESEGSVEECDKLSESFGSYSEFEVMSIQTYQPENERISKYVKDRVNEIRNKSNGETIQVQKIDSIRDPTLNRVKSIKAMVRIDNQIIQLTVDTGSPVSFLNWATAKEIMEKSSKLRFIPSEELNLQTKFVDYNKQPISVLGALKTNLRSAGWEVKGATSLVTERKTRCIMGLDLQGQVGIVTPQKPAPKELTRFDVLMCEQSEGWKEKFFNKFKNLFERQGISKNHIVRSKFKYPLRPIQEKRRRIPIHIQDKVEKEIEKLLTEGHIIKLDKWTSDCFIAPIVITVKKDDSIKLALDAKPINRQLFKNKYQMPNVDELIDGVSQIVTENKSGTLYFTVLDLKYAYSQLKLAADTAKHL